MARIKAPDVPKGKKIIDFVLEDWSVETQVLDENEPVVAPPGCREIHEWTRKPPRTSDEPTVEELYDWPCIVTGRDEKRTPLEVIKMLALQSFVKDAFTEMLQEGHIAHLLLPELDDVLHFQYKHEYYHHVCPFTIYSDLAAPDFCAALKTKIFAKKPAQMDDVSVTDYFERWFSTPRWTREKHPLPGHEDETAYIMYFPFVERLEDDEMTK